MSEEWLETTLGEVATLTIGRTPPRKDPKYWTSDLDRPFCTIADMDGRHLRPHREGVTAAAEDEGKAKRVPAGSLLMSFKLTIGRVGFAAVDVFPNEAIVHISTKADSACDEKYLALWLESQDLTAGSGRAVKGNTLNGDSLRAIKVTVPPLSVQRRIVDLMEHLDTHIARLESEDETADEFQRSLLTALLTDHTRIPASYDTLLRSEGLPGSTSHASSTSHDGRSGGGWEETTLGAVSSFAGGYSFRPDEQGKSTGEVPFIKVSDMNLPGNEIYMHQAANWVDKDALSRLRAKAWDPGTVIFPKVGAALLTEKRRLLRHRSAFDNNIMGLVADKQRLLPEYLFALMCQVKLGEIAQHGAVPSVNQSHLSGIPISLPPLAVQRRIVDLMEHLDTLNAGRNAEIVRLRHLRADLLSSLLSEQTELPDSYDELLGRAS